MGKRKTRHARSKTGKTTEVSASDLKNGWHQYLDRVAQARKEMIVTRYGKPIAKLAPVEEESTGGIFGFLAGSVTIHGDIVAPTGAVWGADG